MITSTVWIDTGLVLIYGSQLDANYHQHVAIQIVWPCCDSSSELNGETLRGQVVIASKHSHCLKMSKGWILLVEPHSLLGEQLEAKLQGQSMVSFELNADCKAYPPLDKESAFQLIAPIFRVISIDQTLLNCNQSSVTDERIQRLLENLDACFVADCIKPQQWRAASVAQTLNLSESRFLHIFKDQVGIAWRPFLLWRRLICALQALVKGKSATDAAYIAGFSDSAHLSRTFRSTFGMSITQAKNLVK
ncbi:helix-turn-helix domain-containing protein [Pseudoalteromonas sp. PPB1]|uniref:helix-turn-helix domain-containing protein n=1 Tax=Pseudoalteromonas sp. PPB1 TaxID=2756136 RepID=UPI002B26CEA8|nr:helix-turn-helix domain-containing protein [Pseudoalteromonas sp. PPB1]